MEGAVVAESDNDFVAAVGETVGGAAAAGKAETSEDDKAYLNDDNEDLATKLLCCENKVKISKSLERRSKLLLNLILPKMDQIIKEGTLEEKEYLCRLCRYALKVICYQKEKLKLPLKLHLDKKNEKKLPTPTELIENNSLDPTHDMWRAQLNVERRHKNNPLRRQLLDISLDPSYDDCIFMELVELVETFTGDTSTKTAATITSTDDWMQELRKRLGSTAAKLLDPLLGKKKQEEEEEEAPLLLELETDQIEGLDLELDQIEGLLYQVVNNNNNVEHPQTSTEIKYALCLAKQARYMAPQKIDKVIQLLQQNRLAPTIEDDDDEEEGDNPDEYEKFILCKLENPSYGSLVVPSNQEEPKMKPKQPQSLEQPNMEIALETKDILMIIFSFMGPGHYFFVAGVSKVFKQHYLEYCVRYYQRGGHRTRNAKALATQTFYSNAFASVDRATFASVDCAKVWYKGIYPGIKHDFQQFAEHFPLCKIVIKNGGNLEVLKWAHRQGFPWKGTCKEAARHGRLQILQYAHQFPSNFSCPWGKATCHLAFKKGHVDCFQYASRHGCRCDRKVYVQAIEAGAVPIEEVPGYIAERVEQKRKLEAMDQQLRVWQARLQELDAQVRETRARLDASTR